VERKHNTFKLTETVKEDRKSGIMVVENEEGQDTLIHVLTNVFQVLRMTIHCPYCSRSMVSMVSRLLLMHPGQLLMH
jgi:hypothetical protein